MLQELFGQRNSLAGLLLLLILWHNYLFLNGIEIELIHLAFDKLVSFVSRTIVVKTFLLQTLKGVTINITCARGYFLVEILVPCLLKRWEPIIDNVRRSVKVLISTSLELVDKLIRNTIYPCFIFIAVLTVSVAIVHNIIMDRRF